jgi:hypothetical protein
MNHAYRKHRNDRNPSNNAQNPACATGTPCTARGKFSLTR